MENIIVPVSYNIYSLGVSTPNGGFLYTSRYNIGYIADCSSGSPIVDVIKYNNFIPPKAVACDPHWNYSKYFAVMDERRIVTVWDLDTKTIVSGHQAHVRAGERPSKDSFQYFVICFTKSQRILSFDSNSFVNFCIASNKYVRDETFLVKKNKISCAMLSPYNEQIIGVGCVKGLVIVANYVNKTVLYTLRGHDSDITSLDWIFVPSSSSEKQANRRILKPKYKSSAADDSDLFDIYSYDHSETEFGTLPDSKRTAQSSDDEIEEANAERNLGEFVGKSEMFDFKEACQNLAEDLRAINDDTASSRDTSLFNVTRDEDNEPFGAAYNIPKAPADIESNLSCLSNGSVNDTFVDACDKLKELILKPKSENEESSNEDEGVEIEGVVWLASGARESTIWIWDTSTGSSVVKISLATVARSPLLSMHTTIAWLNATNLIVNCPGGKVKHCEINKTKNGYTSKQLNTEFTSNAVISLTKLSGKWSNTFWTLSVYRKMECIRMLSMDAAPVTLASFSTACSKLKVITECPADTNKIAFASPDGKINVFNLSTISKSNIQFTPIISNTKGFIHALSWNPFDEHTIAVGTDEGRLAILNTNKKNKNPVLPMPVTGKPIYCIAWGHLTTDKLTNELVVFICTNNMLYYYENYTTPHEVKLNEKVSNISIAENRMAIGTEDGKVIIYDLNDNFKELLRRDNVAKKYIRTFDWNNIDKNRLAIGSFTNTISILDCDLTNAAGTLINLEGHLKVVSSIRWSQDSKDKLLSTSFDGTIRIWNVASGCTEVVHDFGDVMLAALFSPLDDRIIICSGDNQTLEFLNETKPVLRKSYTNKCNLKTKMFTQVMWAVENVKSTPKAIAQLIENVQNIELNAENGESKTETATMSTPNEVRIRSKSKISTFMYLTTKTMNKDALACIKEKLELANNDNQQYNRIAQLFGNRELVKQLIDAELTNLKMSRVISTGYVTLPLICGDLKSVIIDKMKTKTLSPYEISLAPSISHEFWRKCCEAYAYQLVEEELTVDAIPYFLMSQNINEAIEYLCTALSFKEAWILAKIHKDHDDKVFDKISMKWIGFLQSTGNYEAAALVCVFLDKMQEAIDILSKKNNLTEQDQHILTLIKENMNLP